MVQDKKYAINYKDPKIRKSILIRQRRGLWTPEQTASLASHFRLRSGMKLLDAGCGYGYSLRAYGPYCLPGGKLVGIDKENILLKKAARLAESEGLGKNAAFKQADIYSIPFPDNTFDIAIAHVVFCHLDNPAKALDELIRVTKRSGCIAVFDNADTGNGGNDWSNVFNRTIKQRLLLLELGIKFNLGRKKLGYGDLSIGCYLPGWMEQRGLKNVDARTNEKVRWLAPPYKSPAQKNDLRNQREYIAEMNQDPAAERKRMAESVKMLRAGGAGRGLINKLRHFMRQEKERRKRFIRAFKRKTLSYAGSSPFWCVWGFKP